MTTGELFDYLQQCPITRSLAGELASAVGGGN